MEPEPRLKKIATALLARADRLLFRGRRALRLLRGKPKLRQDLRLDLRGAAVNERLRRVVLTGEPYLVARLARIEMEAVVRYENMQRPGSFAVQLGRYLRRGGGPFWWDDAYRYRIATNAGFFPTDDRSLERFARRMIEDLRQVDLIGVYGDETPLIHHLGRALTAPMADLDPYYFDQPWSAALAGKRVLVVYPFEQSIRRQYARRKLLFKNPQALPDFELITLKPVQSIARTRVDFATWFDALDWTCEQMEKIEFDVALIGAGAYGLPLAAHARRLGRIGMHLGGSVQIMFGIRGRRWEDWPFFKELFNEHWMRPLPEETPENFEQVEQGCYW